MISLRKIEEKDRQFVRTALKNLWGSDSIVYSGTPYNSGSLPGFLAEENGRIVGLITYSVQDTICQIISINSLFPGKGIGSLLLSEVEKIAKENKCKKIVVVTTNDAEKALEFYKKKGFTVQQIKKGAVALSRKVKPEIPLFGENGTPIEDEIELEKIL